MQNKLMLVTVVWGMIATAVLVFGFFYISQSEHIQKSDAQVAAVAVPFTKLTDGAHAKVDMQVNYLITSNDELKELWKTMGATTTPPVVDFANNSVLAVFAGNEANGPITVSKIEDGSERLVSITITQMDGSCPKDKLANASYEIVTAPSTTLPITHTYSTQTASCQ